MNKILALREILRVGLTRQNIRAVLPTLKNLRDAEKSMRAAAEKALDDEERALLAADPPSVPTEDAGAKIRSELETYRKTEQQAWRTIDAAVGQQKALAFRRLLGAIPFTLTEVSGNGGTGRFWFQYGESLSTKPVDPFANPGRSKHEEGAPPDFILVPNPMIGNSGIKPPQPDSRLTPDPTRGNPATRPPAPDPSLAPDSNRVNPGAAPPQPDYNLVSPFGAPQPGGRAGQDVLVLPPKPVDPTGGQRTHDSQGAPALPPGVLQRSYTQLNYMPPRLNFAELVELLEQKLAASKK